VRTVWEDAEVTLARCFRTLGDRQSVRRVLKAMAAGTAAVLVAGCGAGQIGTIGSQVAAVNGAQGTAGVVAVRDVRVQFPTSAEASSYPAGANAPLLFTIANSGTAADELISVSTPAATQVNVQGSRTLPGGTALVSGPSTVAPSSTDAPSSTAGATPGRLTAELSNLTQDVKPGLTIAVTFTFAKAGPITVPVPVGAPEPGAP
jgi:copper(I)-binding protein